MSGGPGHPGGAGYTAYHPRWRRARMSTWWWLARGSYLAFILRELSSLSVAWTVLLLLLVIRAANDGAAAYAQLFAWAAQPHVLVIDLVAAGFLIFHAITWFALAPQAMVLRVGGRRLPGTWIVLANYAAWIAISALILWMLRGG